MPQAGLRGAEQIDRQKVHLQRTGNGLRDHCRVAAKHAVGIQRDLQPPVAVLLDLVRRLLRPRHRRVLHRRRGAELVAELRGIGRPVQDGGGAHAGRSCQHAPARQPVALHLYPLPFCQACRHGSGQVKAAPFWLSCHCEERSDATISLGIDWLRRPQASGCARFRSLHCLNDAAPPGACWIRRTAPPRQHAWRAHRHRSRLPAAARDRNARNRRGRAPGRRSRARR